MYDSIGVHNINGSHYPRGKAMHKANVVAIYSNHQYSSMAWNIELGTKIKNGVQLKKCPDKEFH